MVCEKSGVRDAYRLETDIMIDLKANLAIYYGDIREPFEPTHLSR